MGSGYYMAIWCIFCGEGISGEGISGEGISGEGMSGEGISGEGMSGQGGFGYPWKGDRGHTCIIARSSPHSAYASCSTIGL